MLEKRSIEMSGKADDKNKQVSESGTRKKAVVRTISAGDCFTSGVSDSLVAEFFRRRDVEFLAQLSQSEDHCE